MRKFIIVLALFSAIGLFGQSASASVLTFKNRTAPLMTNPFTLVTSVELGEFEKDGVIYGVYGNPSTGEVTALTFWALGGGDVYYFYPTYVYGNPPSDPWEIRIYFHPTYNSGMLEYKGIILYY